MVALIGTKDIGDDINKKIIGPPAAANKLSDMPDFNDSTKLGDGKEKATGFRVSCAAGRRLRESVRDSGSNCFQLGISVNDRPPAPRGHLA